MTPWTHLRFASRWLTAGGCLLIATVALASTEEAPTEAVPRGPAPATLDDLRTFSDAFNIVRRHYVDERPESELLDAALQGMVSSLDPHSAFLGPEAFQAQDDSARGRQAGIGARLEIDDQRRILIEAVYPDGPAWLAGVRDGDLLLAVDGKKVRSHRLRRSLLAVPGEPGTAVTLRLQTGDMPAREVTLERAYVPIPSVSGRLVDKNIALLKLDRFHLATAEEFERRLVGLTTEAGDDLAGIVVDLRGNLGGIIKPAAEIADGFLDEGLVVYTRGRYPSAHIEYIALPGQWAPQVPLAVLVNGSSASASEILAGALQDHGRATIVGTRTYGKGTTQSVLKLRNGSGLKITTARYYTPSGRTFDGTGIEPDVPVSAGEAGETGVATAHAGDDAALEAAIALLRGE